MGPKRCQRILMLPGDCSCDFFFCEEHGYFFPCLNSLPETKVKRFVLIPLAEEILKQSSIDSVVWLSLATLIQIYNEKVNAEKGKIQNVQFEEKSGNGVNSCI